MRKKGLPEITVKAIMSIYDEAKTRFRVGAELSE